MLAQVRPLGGYAFQIDPLKVQRVEQEDMLTFTGPSGRLVPCDSVQALHGWWAFGAPRLRMKRRPCGVPALCGGIGSLPKPGSPL